MLLPILEAEKVAAVHQAFVDRVLEVTDEEVVCKLVMENESVQLPVQHSIELRFWACVLPEPIENTNYWTGCGLGMPREGHPISVALEIAYPVEGMRKGYRAFWAFDGFTKKHYLLHTGKLDGRASGVSQEEFFRLWNGPVHNIGLRGEPHHCAEICVLESPDFAGQLRGFVKRVYQIGQMVKE